MKKKLFKQKIKITNKLKPEIRVKLRLVISTEREHFITGISDIGGASITACARPWLVHCRLNHKFCFLKNMWGNNRRGVLKSPSPSGPVEKKTSFLPVKYTVCSVLLPFFSKVFFSYFESNDDNKWVTQWYTTLVALRCCCYWIHESKWYKTCRGTVTDYSEKDD